MTPALPLTSDLPPRDFHARLARRVRGAGSRRTGAQGAVRGLVLAAAIAVPAVATPHGWRAAAAAEDAPASVVTLMPMPFEQPGASFPGSAYYYMAAAPAPTAGQALDAGAHWDGAAEPGPAARGLSQAGTAIDRMRALTCLTQAIYYEAASEPDAGQRAVAQVVLNRVAHPAYPKTVCGVVYQGSERPTGCQFTFTCDGSLARVPNRLFWQRAALVARLALAGTVYAPVGLATHYHTIAVHPYWADRLAYLGTIGAHQFYRLGGPAGAAGLFNPAAYRGLEPEPGRARAVEAAAGPATLTDPVAIEQAFANAPAPGIPAAPEPRAWQPAGPAPAYADGIAARGGDALHAGDRLPKASAVRPEYERAGQWIARPGT